MNIWQTISRLLNKQQHLYLLTVIESVGSAPGRRGFKMVVADDGTMYGSIGGGIMEFNLVEKAKQLLVANQQVSFVIEQTHSGRSSNSSGMICSGSQIVAFTPLNEQHKNIISVFHNEVKMLQINNNGLTSVDLNAAQVTEIESAQQWRYTELLNHRLTVHLFGAGHVSIPTSELLSKVGFNVSLYDNREGLNTYEANQYTYSKTIVGYDNILQQVSINAQDYVILMTNKFTEDKLLLSQLLTTQCRYLGVLGSDNKIKVMFEALEKTRHCINDLQQVFAPIGLPINSRTVEEIAISIVAEIIQVKNVT